MGGSRRARRWLLALVALAASPWALHQGVERLTRWPAPPDALASVERHEPRWQGEVQRLGTAWSRRRGALREVGLVGTPEQIGWAHTRLLAEPMRRTEGAVWSLFERLVPLSPARLLLMDVAKWRYRGLNRWLEEARAREIAAGAAAFQPDPFAAQMEAYQRFVVLNALYDIALGFEHSPLIGCTTFVVGPSRKEGGGALLARAFDFEADPIFDQEKVVFLVRPAGRLAFASVAWPGLVGVVSGMNEAGLAAVVHGARAGEPHAVGEPVVHALRRVLEEASTVEQAVALLDARAPLVTHLVILADASGAAVVVERSPGSAATVRRLPVAAVVTNHLEGALAEDARNRRVLATTSTLERRARGEELLAELPEQVGPADAVRLLRDRRGAGGVELPLGDRRAIDALIATHGVVMDTERRVLWVSEAPHLLGRFVPFELGRLLRPDYDPAAPEPPLQALPADPLGERAPAAPARGSTP